MRTSMKESTVLRAHKYSLKDLKHVTRLKKINNKKKTACGMAGTY